MVPVGEDGNARACAFMEVAGSKGDCYGVGIDANIVTASIKALISGVNRAHDTVRENAQESMTA
jgi:2-isopropylmalate synthase